MIGVFYGIGVGVTVRVGVGSAGEMVGAAISALGSRSGSLVDGSFTDICSCS